MFCTITKGDKSGQGHECHFDSNESAGKAWIFHREHTDEVVKMVMCKHCLIFVDKATYKATVTKVRRLCEKFHAAKLLRATFRPQSSDEREKIIGDIKDSSGWIHGYRNFYDYWQRKAKISRT